jgi:uncharacterized protein (DUF433 family)
LAYDTAEAARLISWANRQAGVKPLSEAELIEWIDGRVGLLDWADTWEEAGEIKRYIDFPTLISLRLIFQLHSSGMSLEDINEAAPRLRNELGVEWPFASKKIWTFTDSMSHRAASYDGPVSRLDKVLFLLLLKNSPLDLKFDENGVSCEWRPVKDIRIDPRFVSGSPCLDGTRIPTWILPGMVKGEDSIQEIANDYGVAREQVEKALEWERQLSNVGI